jgi:hypothetical protein
MQLAHFSGTNQTLIGEHKIAVHKGEWVAGEDLV